MYLKLCEKQLSKDRFLKNYILKTRTENSCKTYKRQKSYQSRLYKKDRKELFNNLKPSFVQDKIFWKTIKPFFFQIKYEIHPILIKNKIGNERSFKFEAIGVSDIEKEIRTINQKKATPSGNILPKIIKLSSDTTAPTLRERFDESLSNCEFTVKLKLADITPVFKKKNHLDKANYRPVSVLATYV